MGAWWIRNGHIVDMGEDDTHGQLFLEDPDFFGFSNGIVNDICNRYEIDDLWDLKYDDDFDNESHPAWDEMMGIALAKGAIRVRNFKNETWVTYDIHCRKDLINAMLDYPEVFTGVLHIGAINGYEGIIHGGYGGDESYNSVEEALQSLSENKIMKNKRIKESEENFDSKDPDLFDNIQDAIYSILTDYDNEVWEKAGIKRYFEEPTTHGVLVRDQYGSKVFPIHYGLNGPGKDEDYFEAMAKFIVDLEDILKPTYPEVNVYCVNVLVDCADDVGTVVFGVSVGEDIDPKESMKWKESEGGIGKPNDSDEEKTSKWNKGIYKIDHYDEQIDEWEK